MIDVENLLVTAAYTAIAVGTILAAHSYMKGRLKSIKEMGKMSKISKYDLLTFAITGLIGTALEIMIYLGALLGRVSLYELCVCFCLFRVARYYYGRSYKESMDRLKHKEGTDE